MPDTGRSVHAIPITLEAAHSSAQYEVLVGAGLLSGCAERLSRACPAHRYAIISDDRVQPLYASVLRENLAADGMQSDVFTFPAGEEHKTRATWAAVTDAMLAAGLGRDTAVVALGGGVVGDLAGFVAATYMRGLPVAQVPTTLLAMIDASVGGKTAVDTPAGKNLVGAFHQPAVVLADPTVLRTLPDEHFRSGLAEAVKHGAIADSDHLAWIAAATTSLLSGDSDALVELIVRSVQIKADFVSRDERETGPRKALNFGHTIGHAVEAVSGFRLLHGEAVAIGMAVEASIGEAIGVTRHGTAARLREILLHIGLPVAVPPELSREEILRSTRTDKKARAGRVEYALIEELGQAGAEGSWGYAVEDEVVRGVLGDGAPTSD
jgi:3-dehydroquinate synthase